MAEHNIMREHRFPEGGSSLDPHLLGGSPAVRWQWLRRLLGAQFAADTATYAIVFAAVAVVEEMTSSTMRVAWTILSSTLPGLLFGLVAGVVVDRRDRVMVLVMANALRIAAAGCFVLAVQDVTHPLVLAGIYLSCFALSALAQFISPAQAAIAPRLAGDETTLVRLNSLSSLFALGSQGLGVVVLTPLLLSVSGPAAVGMAGVVLYAVATIIASRLPHRSFSFSPSGRSLSAVWSDLREGWHFIAHNRAVTLATICSVAVSATAILLSALAPGLASRVLGVRVSSIAYMAVPAGVGFGVGLVLLNRRKQRWSQITWVSAGLICFGLSLSCFPFMHQWGWRVIPLLLMGGMGLGLGLALVLVPTRTILQEHPPADMRGRVLATQSTLTNLANTLPLPIAGGLADLIGITNVMFLLAFLLMGMGVASAVHSRA
ncbi:MAG: MFS transporter [Chloroflexi bacterium]|nr:MFS transporter [Chloroflexota bacterium]